MPIFLYILVYFLINDINTTCVHFLTFDNQQVYRANMLLKCCCNDILTPNCYNYCCYNYYVINFRFLEWIMFKCFNYNFLTFLIPILKIPQLELMILPTFLTTKNVMLSAFFCIIFCFAYFM